MAVKVKNIRLYSRKEVKIVGCLSEREAHQGGWPPAFQLRCGGETGRGDRPPLAVWLHRVVFGRRLFAVGENVEAARLSDINTSRVIVIAYIICVVLTGVFAIYFAICSRSIHPVSGRVSFPGAEGSIVGVVLGVTLVGVIAGHAIRAIPFGAAAGGAGLGDYVYSGTAAWPDRADATQASAMASASRPSWAVAEGWRPDVTAAWNSSSAL